MNLTVDASIVIKWFVTEPMCDEARLLLARRIHLQAPDLLLAEFANTIWKKVRRKELPEAQPYLEELASLPDIVALYPGTDLIERAARIAFEIDHPIYDCLYLACAETTDSDLITADRRFADKAVNRLPKARVRYIRAPGVADWIETAATSLVIERDKVEMLIAAYDVFARTERSVLDTLSNETEGPLILNDKDQELFLNSPSYRRLLDSISELNDEEHIDLLALGWFGAKCFPSWRRSVEHAERMAANLGPNYTTGYGHHWRAGYTRVTAE